jgi:hypothetical protein
MTPQQIADQIVDRESFLAWWGEHKAKTTRVYCEIRDPHMPRYFVDDNVVVKMSPNKSYPINLKITKIVKGEPSYYPDPEDAEPYFDDEEDQHPWPPGWIRGIRPKRYIG